MSVESEQKCAECGGLIPLGVGHCPACMLGRAMGHADSSDVSPSDTMTSIDGVSGAEGAGDLIGSYKLLEKIGEGGFGVVYMAKQDQPVRRQVALKIIKEGMDTKQVVGRFEAERQALAMMDHPNIATVLDGGSTATGRPYFVMELVNGVPITEFCNVNRLTTEERLRLFVKVCHAVQHAHQKGVIHRDLKPSNILVTMHDDEAMPKVIDFGIAKATQGELTDKTLFTQFRHFLGTPAYMSPEQAQMSGLGVDTRSDIYSLGVLLYELLTGSTPLDLKPAMQSGYDEVRRTIREEEPPKPSTRVSLLGQEEQTTLSKQSRSEFHSIHSKLKGDLDWVVMRAIEKDRGRRYGTADLLAQDIEAFLRDDPVSAVAPSPWYLFGKLARRHKPLVASVAVIIPTILLAAIVSSWMWGRERSVSNQLRTEEQRSRELSDDLAERLDRELFAIYARDVAYAVRLMEETRMTEASEILDHYAPGKLETRGDIDPREFVWFYLKDQIAKVRPSKLPETHGYEIFSLEFSQDGRWLVSTTLRGEVFLWDVLERRLVDRLETGHDRDDLLRQRWALPAFSSDGQFLIVRAYSTPGVENGLDNEVRVWRWAGDKYQRVDSLTYQHFKAVGQLNAERAVRFIPGTHQLLLSRPAKRPDFEEHGFVVYDLDVGEEIRRIENTGSILDLSPSGERVVTRRWLSDQPELVLWDLESGRAVVTRRDVGNVTRASYVDDDWLLAFDPSADWTVALSGESLERGPNWISRQIKGTKIKKASGSSVLLFLGENSFIFDSPTMRHQYLGPLFITDSFTIALHPEGRMIARRGPKGESNEIQLIPLNSRKTFSRLELGDGMIVFPESGDEVWLQPKESVKSRAFRMPSMVSHEALPFDGRVVSQVSEDEIWYQKKTSDQAGLVQTVRTGNSFEVNSIATEGPVDGVWPLRSENLLLFYRQSGRIEIRERESLEVLQPYQAEVGFSARASGSALAKEADILGLSIGSSKGRRVAFLQAETLEPIPWTRTGSDLRLRGLSYLAAEERFLLFHRSGLVEELSVPDLRVVSSYQLGDSIWYGDVSADGRSIAIRRESKANVDIYCRQTKTKLLSLPGLESISGSHLTFSPRSDMLMVRPARGQWDRATTWWSAPREGF